MTTALEAVQAYADSLRKYADQTIDLAGKALKLQPTLDVLGRYHNMHVSVSIGKICIHVNINEKMEEIMPLLETIEQVAGIEFDNTSDFAEYSMRTFKSAKDSWLEVDVRVPSTGEECRSVITGYKEVPIYEIKCGADE